MRRARSGKALALSDRDIEIFRALVRYRYLRSTYLHSFAGGASATRFKERLGDLFHEGYLDRPDRQWEFADARNRPVVYALGTRAQRILVELRGERHEARTFLGSESRQFQHATLICACLASIELATRMSSVRFIAWPEMLAKAPETTRRSPMPQRIAVGQAAIVPDGLFGLEYTTGGTKSYRFFALEVDRGTMPLVRSDPRQTSYLSKLDLYREIIASGGQKAHWAIPNLLVLSVMPDAQRVRGAVDRLDAGDFAACLLFKSVEPLALMVPVSGLLTGPWMRAGLAPFSLCERQ